LAAKCKGILEAEADI